MDDSRVFCFSRDQYKTIGMINILANWKIPKPALKASILEMNLLIIGNTP